MKGSRPPITSRMDFHYDFILKTLQASEPDKPLKWLQIMEQSYWFQQHQTQLIQTEQRIEDCTKKIKDIMAEESVFVECQMRRELERTIKTANQSTRKEIQRKLDSLKNKQFGPKWDKALSDYDKLSNLQAEKQQAETDLAELQEYQNTIQPCIDFLHSSGYIKHNDSKTLTNQDLTLKGILATEINEGHQILMTELYTQEWMHSLSGDDLVTVLACFQESNEKDDNPSIHNITIPEEVRSVLMKLYDLSMEFYKKEQEYMYPSDSYWTICTKMIEPMRRWVQGENASVICQEYDLFEGNFIRSVMKMANMLDEWLAMATYCQHVDQIEKIVEVRQRIIRDVIVSDSLYLHI
jgi:superfamily II RNA helicase